MSQELDIEQAHALVREVILTPPFRRATFGGKVRGTSPWQRVIVRPVEVGGIRHLQFAYFDRTKDVTRNLSGPEAQAALEELLAAVFGDVHLTTASEEIDLRTSKRGKVFVARRSVETAVVNAAHNRVKEVPLPERQASRLLEVMGILTHSGSVRPTMRAKWTQINEFLKQLDHVLDEGWVRALGRPVRIVDCGCGASYLTLAVHHYLNDVRGLPATLLGIDVNDEVIRKSVERGTRLGGDGLGFTTGRIDALAEQPDIVIALHACDTATDDALAQAVLANAQILLSVPCCHHHLNAQLRAAGPAEVLRPLLRHGILHQRTADLVTDAFRALALRILGYRTEVVEFISVEHTARNLMIRAVRGLPVGEAAFVREYQELRAFWGVVPFIETALGEAFQAVLNQASGAASARR